MKEKTVLTMMIPHVEYLFPCIDLSDLTTYIFS